MRKNMNRVAISVIALIALTGTSFASGIAFRKAQILDSRGRGQIASLVFDEQQKAILVEIADHPWATIPYATVDKLGYEYSKRHRIREGAVIMIASLGAGAVVMLTKSKSHWLYIDYKEQGTPKSVLLRLDKKEYKHVLTAAENQTGKRVEYLNDTPGAVMRARR
jgi:hypothetical protein